ARVWNCRQRAADLSPADSPAGKLPAAPSGTNSCPTIEVSYRNLTNIYFRAVAYDWNVFLQKNHSRPEYLNDAERQELITKTPTFEWSAQLPPTTDFKERTETLDAPSQLKAGFYFLIASTEPGFSGNDNPITYTDIRSEERRVGKECRSRRAP